MRAGKPKERRLSGAHISLITVAVCATLAPTAVYAAERMISIIGDPYNSSALARVSEDGRLGVRGETTTQEGVPSNEWHRNVDTVPGRFQLLKAAPAGSGIGLSQLTILWSSRGTSVYADVGATYATRCLAEMASGADFYLHAMQVPLSPDRSEPAAKQDLFPVPLTVPASPTEEACLYVRGITRGVDGVNRPVKVYANGVIGPMTAAFEPAKGEQATTPGDGGEETKPDEQG